MSRSIKESIPFDALSPFHASSSMGDLSYKGEEGKL